MFKLFLFACFLSFAATKPGILDPVAYTAAYTTPVAAAYTAPVAALAYSAYTAPVEYSAYSYASPYSTYYFR